MAYVPYSVERIKRKLLVVGDQGVGKTSLVMRYATGKPPTQYKPFIYEDYYVTELVDEKTVELWVVDTAGTDDFGPQRRTQYTNAHVILLAFAVDCHNSFQSISERWIQEVKIHAPNATLILLGLKRDSRGDPVVIERMKEKGLQFVDVREALTLANNIQARTYIECSSHMDINVQNLFEEAIRGALEKEFKNDSSWQWGKGTFGWLVSGQSRRRRATTWHQGRNRRRPTSCVFL